MGKIYTLLSIIVTFGSLQAQNLVPNPSFETVVTAPCSWLTAPNQLPAAVTSWTMPTNGSTDIFSNYVATSCYAHNFSTNSSAMGQQAPHTGNVQSALVMYGNGCGSNYREYLQVQLTSPLVSGQNYDLEFWVSLADYSYLATGNFGMRFNTATTFVATCDNILQTPQFNSTTVVTDKTGWVKVSGTITATANWSYIIIGNFLANAATSTVNVGSGTLLNTRYFIDDISVRLSVLDVDDQIVLSGERDADGAVNLDWTPQDVPPADGWSIQRSADGNAWETVAEPTSEVVRWDDRFAPSTALQYRLRYRDDNGGERVTNTIQISKAEGLPYRLYLSNNGAQKGSPVHARISNADATIATLSVRDLQGQDVWTSEAMELTACDNQLLPTENLRPGIYLVSLKVGSKVLTARLLVSE